MDELGLEFEEVYSDECQNTIRQEFPLIEGKFFFNFGQTYDEFIKFSQLPCLQ